MREDRSVVDAVIHHPRLEGLARSDRERARMNRFARDLARWMVGSPSERLGALTRVVTIVARRELRDARRLSKDRPLLAVEASARAVQTLWPLLRGPEEEEEEEEDEEEDETPPKPESESAESGESGTASGQSDGEQDDSEAQDGDEDGEDGEDGEDSEDGQPMDPLDVLKALAEMDQIADPELDALAERLRERMGAGDPVDIAADAGELLEDAGQAAAEGAIETDKVARHLERFLPGVGWSKAPGALERSLLEQLDGLVELLDRLQDLKKLADALGRMEEPTKERGLVQGGREEVVGVHFSGDITTALPSELALLADPETEDLFYSRYVEHRLISLELTGSGDDGNAAGDKRGPVIACIDTSGSMEGAPEMAAKALVLAVCRRVLPRGRTVHLILFGGPGERTELRLRRGRGGLEQLLSFLLMSFHSGTDFDGPLMRAMDLLEEKELLRADILVVTDGLCRATHDVIERVVDVRDRTGARVWSVVLGRSDPRGVEAFSHEVFVLDPEGAAEASGLLRGL